MSIIKKIFTKASDDKAAKTTKKAVAKVEVEEKESKKEPTTQKATVVKSDEGKREVKKKADMEAYKIVTHPLITEKVTDLAALNKYVFVVPVSANKSEIKKKIRNIYGVVALKINIIKRPGRAVRYGRSFGQTKAYKKAIVTLAPESKIEVYEGV